MSEAKTFEQIQNELALQTTRLSALENAARRSRTISAIISLSGAIAGLAIGLFAGAFLMAGELDIWERIKDAHRAGKAQNIVYDHTVVQASVPEVDLSEFVKRAEIRQVVVSIMEQISTGGRNSNTARIEAEVLKVLGTESCVHSRSALASRAKRNLDLSGFATVAPAEILSQLDALLKGGVIAESQGLIRLKSDGSGCP